MAKKIKASTQVFTQVRDISEDVVVLAENYACLVIEVQATNFALLSPEEQEAKIVGYAALLNSLAFPIQILVRSKKMDISSYVKQLEREMAAVHNDKLKTYISEYLAFIQDMVKKRDALDKKFYIAISYSPLEQGIVKTLKMDDFITHAKASLRTKATSLHAQLVRIGLVAKTLQKSELIALFYEMFNTSDKQISAKDAQQDIERPVIGGTK